MKLFKKERLLFTEVEIKKARKRFKKEFKKHKSIGGKNGEYMARYKETLKKSETHKGKYK